MRFLLLGGTGQVGEELRAIERSDKFEIVAPSRAELDLTDSAGISRIVSSEPWAAVINAAAYTDVDRAEQEEPLAFTLNGEAPKQLAKETARRDVPLIHVSTDYVFDGCKGAPYVETDRVNPLSAYGRSKLAGERAIQAGNPRHVILRTSWVYSAYRKNFVKTILRLANEREELRIVDDQQGCPTAAYDIAKTCIDLAIRCASEAQHVPYGVYHFTGDGEISWFNFAKSIVEMASSELKHIPKILPIKTNEYPTPAIRPADTRLDCSKIVQTFSIKPRPWRDALHETVREMMATEGIK